jgi:hypothetical protein
LLLNFFKNSNFEVVSCKWWWWSSCFVLPKPTPFNHLHGVSCFPLQKS